MIEVEIDKSSGFCFGVTRAITKAEEELAAGGTTLLSWRYRP
jgi:4-hydroxy-3-methylbut-2-enyl diphosphate reductase